MSLVVEDGSIVSGAVTFISATDADAYFTARSNTAWAAASTSAKEAALVKATDYLCGLSWDGTTVDSAQPLCWPRSGMYDRDGWAISSTVVPEAVKRACCELALEALSKDLNPALDRGGRVSSVSVPGAVSVTYQEGAPAGKTRPTVDALLAGLVQNAYTVSLGRC